MNKRKGINTGFRLALALFCLLFPAARILAQNNQSWKTFPRDTLPEIRVTLAPDQRTINQVLDEISLQTGYHFTYNADLVPGREKIHFGVRDLLLEETLDSLLGKPRMAYRLIDRNIVIYRKNISHPTPVSTSVDRSILEGSVVDDRTGKPLEFATIALFGTTLGSITNQSGEFAFKLPTSINDPMLVISFIGYKSRYIPVKYPLPEEVTIGLEKETIPLQEVIIRYSDPELLLREALDRIPLNYLDNHSTMTAFYRESARRNQRYMLYSEAVLDVAKVPYDGVFASDLVRIHKGRKITDISSKDSVIVKLRSGIYTSFGLDVVKNRPDFLQRDFLKWYNLEFTDIMTYGEELVYVISFSQKENIDALLFQGQIYLDQETLAIVSVDFQYNPELIHKEPGLFLISRSPHINIRPVYARYHADYRKSGDRYHLSQVRGEVELMVRKRRRWIGARYNLSLEMAITDVNPGKKLQITSAERVRPTQVLADQPFEFDPLFWGVHNTIQPEATLREAIDRIEENLQEFSEQ